MNEYIKLPADFDLSKFMKAETPEQRDELEKQAIEEFTEHVSKISQLSLEQQISGLEVGLENAKKENSKRNPLTQPEAEYEIKQCSTLLKIAYQEVAIRKQQGKWQSTNNS